VAVMSPFQRLKEGDVLEIREAPQVDSAPRAPVAEAEHDAPAVPAAPSKKTPRRERDVASTSAPSRRAVVPDTPDPQEHEYRVVFEDDALLIVSKGAMLLSVPRDEPDGSSLLERLRAEHPLPGDRRIHAVHRLDQGVSGLLVFAKSARLSRALRDQFAARKPERIYVALVSGKVEPRRGTFRSRLATGEGLRRFTTGSRRPEHERKHLDDGELAITHYEVDTFARGVTRVRVRLDTGRRHQIRVQFAEAGWPLLGDRRYGGRESLHASWPEKRIALHAAVLGFVHPKSGEMMRFEAAPPEVFGAVMGDR